MNQKLEDLTNFIRENCLFILDEDCNDEETINILKDIEEEIKDVLKGYKS